MVDITIVNRGYLKAYVIVRFPLVAHHTWSHFSAFPTICWGARITSKTRTANVGTMAPLPKSCRTHQSPARWHFTSLIEGSHLNHQPQAVTLDRGWIPHGETTKGGDVSYPPTNKLTPAILSNTQCNLSKGYPVPWLSGIYMSKLRPQRGHFKRKMLQMQMCENCFMGLTAFRGLLSISLNNLMCYFFHDIPSGNLR